MMFRLRVYGYFDWDGRGEETNQANGGVLCLKSCLPEGKARQGARNNI